MNGLKGELRITNYQLRIGQIILMLCLLGGLAFSIGAQSTNQSFPTAITTNEISGKIAARDLGDARLTSFFYVFNAAQGDVFINVVTTNLNGDIDIFTADNLRPLSKITLYADASDSETGRVVYLRQPTKLILRIEGRTPNDAAATFRVKFAGNFAPALLADNPEAETPQIKTDNQTDVRVNSVGTIIEIKPKPTPQPKETIAAVKPAAIEQKAEIAVKTEQPIAEAKVENEKKPQVIVTEQIGSDKAKIETVEANEVEEEKIKEVEASKVEKAAVEKSRTDEAETAKVITEEPAAEKTESETAAENAATAKVAETKRVAKSKRKPVKSAAPAAPNPLAGIRLVVNLKDGSTVEHPMSEVERVNVVKGILTIITKDGKIERYSILDVTKTTIE